MPIAELILVPVIAALAGRLLRVVAGLLAMRTGHSRREAEDAAATAGFSLVAHPRNGDQPMSRPRVGTGV